MATSRRWTRRTLRALPLFDQEEKTGHQAVAASQVGKQPGGPVIRRTEDTMPATNRRSEQPPANRSPASQAAAESMAPHVRGIRAAVLNHLRGCTDGATNEEIS